MLIIFGLGNPGEEYAKTRHNAGFILLEKIKEEFGFSDFEFAKKFDAQISKGKIGKKEVLLAKPLNFMNESGSTVRAILDFYKLSCENIIVIHDDLDIVLGEVRMAADSRSAGHNGVQNIIDRLGTQKFKRIRIGISKTPEEKAACPLSAHDFVLENFSPKELEKLEKIYPEVLKNISS